MEIFFQLSFITFVIVIGGFSLLIFRLQEMNTRLELVSDNEAIQSETEENPKKREYSSLTDEDKIIIDHLCQRHRTILEFGNALETKFSQMIALNGLILSFILVKGDQVQSFYIYSFGLICLIVTILIGIYGYKPVEWHTGLNEFFFQDYDEKFKNGKGIIELKKRLLTDIKLNTNVQTQKSYIFNHMLYFNIIGLVIVIIGYYV